MRDAGTRSVPSLRYTLARTPIWGKEYQSNPIERMTETDSVPMGGLGWDGRFNTPAQQAGFPLLAPNEMANASVAEVVARLSKSPYEEQFRKVFGQDIFSHPEAAFAALTAALERFEFDDPSFHPYDSKYDLYLDGKVALSNQERRGLKLFSDPDGGNCTSCHIAQSGANGSHPLFTDFSFEALGVPRNPEIPANADAAYYDLGLCGPVRTDQHENQAYCGLFKTPSLRNVATRGAFFHNGRFHDLADALRFYVERDTSPRRWYPHAGGAQHFDDLPVALQNNVDRIDAPLTRHEGDAAVWSEADIADVVAFLKTLTDGYAGRQDIGPKQGGSRG
jgi:cytochrome c peroxidase